MTGQMSRHAKRQATSRQQLRTRRRWQPRLTKRVRAIRRDVRHEAEALRAYHRNPKMPPRAYLDLLPMWQAHGVDLSGSEPIWNAVLVFVSA